MSIIKGFSGTKDPGRVYFDVIAKRPLSGPIRVECNGFFSKVHERTQEAIEAAVFRVAHRAFKAYWGYECGYSQYMLLVEGELPGFEYIASTPELT